MSEITGGSVTYGRTVNTGDYNSKKAEVTLTFACGEGETLDRAAELAVFKCHEILFKTSAGAASRSDTSHETVPQGSSVTAPAGPPKRGRKPKDETPNLDPTDPRVASPETAAPTQPATAGGQTPAATADAASVVEEPGGPTNGGAAHKNSVSSATADPAAISDDDLLSPSAPEVTDVDLTQAITKKNAEIQNPVAIRALIGEFVTPPKKATDIPQGERGRFLEKLADLKKAA